MNQNISRPASPFGGFNSKIDSMTSGAWDMVKKGFGGGNGFGGGDGGYAAWGKSAPLPNDPLVGGYMENLGAGSAGLMNNYIDRAANAGPSRGGMNVAGASDPASVMQMQALKNLSGDYRNNYSQAMDWATKYYGGEADNWKTASNLLNSMLGTQLSGLNSQAGFDTHLYDTENTNTQRGIDYARSVADRNAGWGREDVVDTRNYARGAADRAWQERQRAQQQAAWDKAKYDMQAKQQQTDMDRAIVQRQNWRGQGGGWLDSGMAGDAAMRLAHDSGIDWWRDPARGGGGGSSGGGGGNNAASWAGFTSGLLRGAGA
jgi:hypothetical protein